jgi:hypothetical protein
VSCETPDCRYCAEEKAAAEAESMIIGLPCGDVHDAGDGPVSCTLIRGHEGRHTDGGDEWSWP